MNRDIVAYFLDLVKIDSESREELRLAKKLEADLREIGARVEYDDAGEKIGGTVGNLYARFDGAPDMAPLLLMAHMDTVRPGKGVKPKIENDAVRASGDTILGADDKSGISEILFAIDELKREGAPLPPLEVVFTVAEEIGLLGAKHVDFSRLKAKVGLAMDYCEIGKIAIAAPSQNNLRFVVQGKEAHAGVEPEKGVNAIKIAAAAIAECPCGRIDLETTCNLGVIEGGLATNIIPNRVTVKGEARSHSPEKLARTTAAMIAAFRRTAERYSLGDFQASVEVFEERAYDAFAISEDALLCRLAKTAGENVGVAVNFVKSGAGSDANVFNLHGVQTLFVGTGMSAPHTVNESVRTADLRRGTDWLKALIALYAKSGGNPGHG